MTTSIWFVLFICIQVSTFMIGCEAYGRTYITAADCMDASYRYNERHPAGFKRNTSFCMMVEYEEY